MKVAVIINGQLRFDDKDHLEQINKLTNKCDVYIKTYKKYEKLLPLLNYKKVLPFITNENYKYLPREMQFKTLQSVLKEVDLSGYDVIVKIRTDADFTFSNLYDQLKKVDIKDSIVYSASDIFFYANAKHFIYVFNNIYDFFIENNVFNSDKERRPILPNYNNLAYSNFYCNGSRLTRWCWVLFPKYIKYGQRWDSLKENIKNEKERLESDRNSPREMSNYHRYTEVWVHEGFCSERWFVQFVLEKSVFYPPQFKKVNLKDREDRKSYNNPWIP